jgi:hypothetical protein
MVRTALVFITAMFLMVGCSENTTTPDNGKFDDKNSFTGNGGGYTNSQFTGYKSDPANGVSLSSTTSIVFKGENSAGEVFAINMLVNGTAVGEYPINSTSGNAANIVITQNSTQTTYLTIPGSGKITIAETGAPGARCKGTFNCTVISLDGTKQIVLTNGMFDLTIDT